MSITGKRQLFFPEQKLFLLTSGIWHLASGIWHLLIDLRFFFAYDKSGGTGRNFAAGFTAEFAENAEL